jgi:hypothetical protein
MALLASCSSGQTPAPTPVPVDIHALQTAAVQTVIANVTQTALAQPTSTPVPPTETLAPPTPTETPTPAVTATAQQCDNSAWISDVSVPDGTHMVAGQEFIKTWKVKNTGTCTWTTGYRIVFSYGEKMSGLPTPLSAEVAPGTEVELSVNLKAPLKNGNFFANWRLANNNGYAFGEGLTVAITVP